MSKDTKPAVIVGGFGSIDCCICNKDNVAGVITAWIGFEPIQEEICNNCLKDNYITHDQKRYDIKKQDELVSALYRFSEGIQENPHDSTYGEGFSKSIHLNSVGKALKEIMRIFGYDVEPI